MPTVSVMTMVFGYALESGACSDADMIGKLQCMGMDGIEVPSRHLLAHPELVEVYRKSPLPVTCVDAGCNLVSRDRETRESAIATLKASIELARALASPVTLAAGSCLTDGVNPEEGREMIVEGLSQCLPLAQDAGMALAIEDFGVEPELQCRVADCLAVLRAVPGLSFVFDTGNFYFAGDNPLDAFDPLLRYTRHVHLKDWVKSEQPDIADVAGAPLGEGIIPNEGLVRRFLHRGIDSFSLEVGAPGDKFDATRRDLETLREWLPSKP